MRAYTMTGLFNLLCLTCFIIIDNSLQSEDNDGVFSMLDGNESGATTGGGSHSSTFDCSKLDEFIVNRFEWNARSPVERLERFRQTPTRVFVHSTQLFLNDKANRRAAVCQTETNGAKCAAYLRQVQAHHQFTNKWPDIGYNYLIAHDGTIYEGLGALSQGFHTANYNNESLGISFIGDYQTSAPNSKMESSLIDLLGCLVDLNHLDHDYTLHGHRDARCTPCPGRAAYARLRSIAHFRPGMLARYTCPTNGQSNLVVARERRQLDSRTNSDQVSKQQQQRQRLSTRNTNLPEAGFDSTTTTTTNRRMLTINHAAEIKPANEHEIVDETGPLLVMKHRVQPYSSQSSTVLAALDREQVSQVARRREQHVAAISKGTQDKQLILINVPTAQTSAAIGVVGQQQTQLAASVQPAFYLLTTTKAKMKSPSILLLNPTQSLTGSSGGGGGGDERGSSGGGGGGGGSRGGQEQSSGGGDGERGSSGGGGEGSPSGGGSPTGGGNGRRRQLGSSSEGGGAGGGGAEEGGRGNSPGGETSRQQSPPGGGGGGAGSASGAGGRGNGRGEMESESIVSGSSHDFSIGGASKSPAEVAEGVD